MDDMKQVSRSITINGRRTSIRMELAIWNAVDDIAKDNGMRMRDLIALIDRRRDQDSGLTAKIRVFVTVFLRQRVGLPCMQPVSFSLAKSPVPPAVNDVLKRVA